jgi:hypothetical protein
MARNNLTEIVLVVEAMVKVETGEDVESVLVSYSVSTDKLYFDTFC